MTIARRARLASGLSPDDFAELVGTDTSTYLGWETGMKKPGKTATALLRLIEADPELALTTLRPDRDYRTGTVLVVVDDEAARSALWDLCEDAGFDVATGASGWHAIEFLKKTDEIPCAIVLDVTLPVINGWQLMSWLQHQGAPLANVPVITVSEDPTHAEAAVKNGVARHFPKPIDVSSILEEIKHRCKKTAA